MCEQQLPRAARASSSPPATSCRMKSVDPNRNVIDLQKETEIPTLARDYLQYGSIAFMLELQLFSPIFCVDVKFQKS